MTVPAPPRPGGAAPGESSGQGQGQVLTVQQMDHVVTLVSSCVVNQRAWTNNSGVPLGAHIDFIPPQQLNLPQITTRLPVRCRGCGGYLNVYCKTNLAKHVWKCNLCGNVNVDKDNLTSQDPLAYPELCAEAVEYACVPLPPNSALPAAPAGACSHLALVLDGSLDQALLDGARTGLRELLAGLPPATRVSLLTFDGAVALHHLGPGPRRAHVLPGSRPLEQGEVAALVEGSGATFTADLASCSGTLDAVLAGLRPLHRPGTPLRPRPRATLPAVEAALRLVAAEAGLDLAQHARAPPGARLLVLTAGPPTRGPGALPLDLVDGVEARLSKAEREAAGAAAEAGAALGVMAAKIGVALDVLPGIARGYSAPVLGAAAAAAGGEVCPHPGFGPLLGAALAACVGRRWGLAACLDCYASEGLRLVQWMGPLDTLRDEQEALLLAPPPRPGSSGSSAGGAAAGGQQDKAGATAAAVDAGMLRLALRAARRLSPSACSVTALEAGRGAALRLELTRDLEAPGSAILQVVLQWVDPSRRSLVSRVCSRKLAVVDRLPDYLRGTNPLAAAALLGKRLVLDAKKAGAPRDPRRAEELRAAVAAQLALIASRCGRQVTASRGLLGLGARKAWQWPADLMPLAYALYHFQRGPLLGPLPHTGLPPGTVADERATALDALLRAAWGDAYRMMSPKLYAITGGVPGLAPPPPGGPEAGQSPLAALPCVDLAALLAGPGRPLLLDHGSVLLLAPSQPPEAAAGGAEGEAAAQQVPSAAAGAAAAAALAPYREVALRLAASRFPLPPLAPGGPAQAGRGELAARLIPIHDDDYYDQTLQHPALAALGPGRASALGDDAADAALTTAERSLAAAAEAGVPPPKGGAAALLPPSFVAWCRSVSVAPFPPPGAAQ